MGLLWVRVAQVDPSEASAHLKSLPTAIHDQCGGHCPARHGGWHTADDHHGPGVSVKDAGFASYVGGRPEGFSEGEHDDPHGSNFDEDMWDRAQPSKGHYDEYGDPSEGTMEDHARRYEDLYHRTHSPDSTDDELHDFQYKSGGDNEFWKTQPVVDLPHDTPVHATQPYVFRKHINKYLHDRQAPTHQLQQLSDMGTHSHIANEYEGNSHPYLVKHQGKVHVLEGHHRVASDLLAQRPIRGRFFDADAHGGLPQYDEDEDSGEYIRRSGSRYFACPECYTERSECCHGGYV